MFCKTALLESVLIISLFGASFSTCPHAYNLDTDGLCLSVSDGPGLLSKHEDLCNSLNPKGVPFLSRMNDRVWDDFKKHAKTKFDVSPIMSYVGMQKITSLRGPPSWEFTDDKGTVKESDYAFWVTDPQGEECGVLDRISGYMVRPVNCRQRLTALCEKTDKPCFHAAMFYAEYFDRCISLSSQDGDYPYVGSNCLDGFIPPLTNEQDKESLAAALATGYGGIYGGLRRKDDRWFYASGGDEEKERINLDYPGTEDCSVWGMTGDGEIISFSTNCESNAYYLCEYVGKEVSGADDS